MRKRTRIEPSSGSKWMSDVPCSAAWAMIWLTSLMTGASSAVSRRSTISPGPSSSVAEVDLGGRRDVLQPRLLGDQDRDVLARGDRDADLVAGHQRDVVDRQDVGRVGHRDQQPALAGERDRDRLVALGGLRVDEVGRRHVDVVDAEVEVVEAVALGDGARVVLLRQAPWSSSTCSGVVPVGARGLDGLLDARAVDEAQLDDDVGQEAGAAAAGPARRRDAVPVRWTFVGRRGGRRGRGRRRRERRGRARVSDRCRRGSAARRSDGSLVPGSLASGFAPRAASRIASTGASRPVQASKLNAPWRTRTSSPSTTVHPRRRASATSSGAAGPVDQVRHGRVCAQRIGVERQILELPVGQPDTRAVDQKIGRRWPSRRLDAEVGGQRAARSGVRFQTLTRAAPASRSAWATPRALPPAPSTSAVWPAGSTPRRRARRGSPARRCWRRGSPPSSANVSVLAAPIARAAAVAASASASAASLCGIVTLAPTKPGGGQRAHRLLEDLGRHRQPLVVPVLEPELGQRRVVHRAASGCGRPASRGPRGASSGLSSATGPCRRAASRFLL